MSIEENKAFTCRYLEQLHQDKSPAALEPYIAEELLMQHIAFYESVFPGYWLEAQDLIAEGDKVVCRAVMHGTQKGELMGIPATGETIHMDLIIIYQIANGKIVNHWMQTDAVSLLQQLGALPAPA